MRLCRKVFLIIFPLLILSPEARSSDQWYLRNDPVDQIIGIRVMMKSLFARLIAAGVITEQQVNEMDVSPEVARQLTIEERSRGVYRDLREYVISRPQNSFVQALAMRWVGLLGYYEMKGVIMDILLDRELPLHLRVAAAESYERLTAWLDGKPFTRSSVVSLIYDSLFLSASDRVWLLALYGAEASSPEYLIPEYLLQRFARREGEEGIRAQSILARESLRRLSTPGTDFDRDVADVLSGRFNIPSRMDTAASMLADRTERRRMIPLRDPDTLAWLLAERIKLQSKTSLCSLSEMAIEEFKHELVVLGIPPLIFYDLQTHQASSCIGQIARELSRVQARTAVQIPEMAALLGASLKGILQSAR